MRGGFIDTTMTQKRDSPFGANQVEAELLKSEARLLNSIENNADYSKSFKELAKAYNSHTRRIENRTRTRLTKLQVLNRLQRGYPVDYDTLLGGDPKGSTQEAKEEANRIQDHLASLGVQKITRRNYVKELKLVCRSMRKDPDTLKWIEDTDMLSEPKTYPKSIRWMSQYVKKSETRKTPEETLTQGEIDRIIEHLPTETLDRSLATIQLCRNVGLRAGELLALKYSSFEFKNGVAIAVNIPRNVALVGWEVKTFARSLPLSISQVPVTKWLERVKKCSPIEDPWFVSDIRTGEPITMIALFKPIKKAAKRAKISESKRVHSLGLRSTTASHLYNAGVPTQDIKKFMGWDMTSTMVDQYVVENTDNLARSVNAAFGASEMVEAHRGIEMVECYNCRRQTPNTSDHARCQHCYVQLVPVNREESTAELVERIATQTAIATANSMLGEREELEARSGIVADLYEIHRDTS